MTNTPPNDIRSFLHKKLFGAAKGFVTSGFNPLGAVGGFLGADNTAREGSKQRGRSAKLVTRRDIRSVQGTGSGVGGRLTNLERAQFKDRGFFNTAAAIPTLPQLPFVGCVPPFFENAEGRCELDLVPGPGGGGTGPARTGGAVVMGRYGAGEMPGTLIVNRAVCRPGMVVGDDGVCYNRSQIKNSERQWPRGRRPLLTGGDMRAISTAARAGRRLEGASKRLQKIGLMKSPAKGPNRKMIEAQVLAKLHHST